MRVPDTAEGMANICDMLLERKEELMGVIETYPAVMSSGRASPLSSEQQSYIANAADDEFIQISASYTMTVGEDKNHIWKIISYLLCGRINAWRSVRLFFVWKMMNADASNVTLETPESI